MPSSNGLCGQIRRWRDHHHAAARVWPYEVNREALEGEDRPRRCWGHRQAEEEQPLSPEFKLRVVEAYLRGEGDCKALALEHGVRNSAQIRDWVKRYREGGDDALAVHPPGRRRKEPASEETLEQRCARLEMEVEILKRMAASATALSAAGGSTR